MISFENTEIAFRRKSKFQLKKAYFLFKIIASSNLVKISQKLVLLATTLHIPIKWAIKPTIYSHFCGGETIQESLPTIQDLEKYNVKGILDYSVEGKESEEDIKAALEETLKTIKNAKESGNTPFAVFKPTAFTSHHILKKVSEGGALTPEEEKEAQKFRDRVNILCSEAYHLDIPILIDAEDVWFQKFIDDTVNSMMALYNKEKAIVFNTFQMYRVDRLDYLKKSYDMAVAGNYYLGAKFVRGAYMEKERERAKEGGYPDPIQPTKDATDNDFNAALKFSMDHIDRIYIFNGTHNEYSSQYLRQLMEEKGIAKNDPRVYFSQLYGMSDHISFNLGYAGYNVAKYVPYGPVKHVLPYLFRRAEENTSAKGQTGRELSLILTEMERRKRLPAVIN